MHNHPLILYLLHELHLVSLPHSMTSLSYSLCRVVSTETGIESLNREIIWSIGIVLLEVSWRQYELFSLLFYSILSSSLHFSLSLSDVGNLSDVFTTLHSPSLSLYLSQHFHCSPWKYLFVSLPSASSSLLYMDSRDLLSRNWITRFFTPISLWFFLVYQS